MLALAPPGDVQLAEVAASGMRYHGTQVRWGGTVVDIVATPAGREVEVLERKIDDRGQPYPTSSSAGRFALVGIDTNAIRVGDDLTVAGHLRGVSERRLGSDRRWLPRVEAASYYRWPRVKRGIHHHHHHPVATYLLPFVYVALLIGLSHYVDIHYHYGHHHHR